MGDSPSAGEQQDDFGEEMMELNKDLESMIEDVENMSVQLSWMAYDMVVQRTTPELGDSLVRLEKEYLRCKAVISGSPGEQDQGQGKEIKECPEAVAPTSTPLT